MRVFSLRHGFIQIPILAAIAALIVTASATIYGQIAQEDRPVNIISARAEPSCTPTGPIIGVFWNQLAGETSYSIFRSSGGPLETLTTSDGPVFTDSAVVAGQQYIYNIQGQTTQVLSNFVAATALTVCGQIGQPQPTPTPSPTPTPPPAGGQPTPTPTPPVAGQTITLTTLPGCTGTAPNVGLFWNQITGANNYLILRDDQPLTNSTSNITVYTDRDVAGGSTHTYQIITNTGVRSTGATVTVPNCQPAGGVIPTPTPTPTPSPSPSAGGQIQPPANFNLVSPVNGATNVNNNPTFNWQDAQGATYYWIYLGQAGEGWYWGKQTTTSGASWENGNGWQTCTGCPAKSVPTTLTTGRWLWTVTAYNASSQSLATPFSFEVGGTGTTPTPPTGDTTLPIVSITSPTHRSTVSGVVTITVEAQDPESGIAQVDFRLVGDTLCQKTATPYTCSWNTTNYANGDYTISVWARNGSGLWGSEVGVTVTVNNPAGGTTPPVQPTANQPGAFSLISPADNAARVSNNPDFDWTDAAGAQGYWVYIGQSGAGWLWSKQTTQSQTSWENGNGWQQMGRGNEEPPSSLNNGSWSWTITAFNSAGTTNVGQAFTFTVSQPGTAPSSSSYSPVPVGGWSRYYDMTGGSSVTIKSGDSVDVAGRVFEENTGTSIQDVLIRGSNGYGGVVETRTDASGNYQLAIPLVGENEINPVSIVAQGVALCFESYSQAPSALVGLKAAPGPAPFFVDFSFRCVSEIYGTDVSADYSKGVGQVDGFVTTESGKPVVGTAVLAGLGGWQGKTDSTGYYLVQAVPAGPAFILTNVLGNCTNRGVDVTVIANSRVRAPTIVLDDSDGKDCSVQPFWSQGQQTTGTSNLQSLADLQKSKVPEGAGTAAQITGAASPHLVNEFTWCSGGQSYIQFVWNPAQGAVSHDLFVNGLYFENVESPYSRVVTPGMKIAEWSVAANFANDERAWPDNGIWGGWSADACLGETTPAAGDTQAPTVAITSLEEGQQVVVDTWIWVAASDNIAPSQQPGFHVGLFVDDVDFNSPHDTDWAQGDDGFAVLLRIKDLANGKHQLIVHAFDRAGNGSDPSSVTVNVFNKPPILGVGQVPPQSVTLDDVKNYIRSRVDDNRLAVPAGFVGAGTHSFGMVLWGLMGCESDFKFDKPGAAGEVGPFQYLPGTFRGTTIGRSGASINDPIAQVDATVELLSGGGFSHWTCFKPNQWKRYWTQFTEGW